MVINQIRKIIPKFNIRGELVLPLMFRLVSEHKTIVDKIREITPVPVKTDIYIWYPRRDSPSHALGTLRYKDGGPIILLHNKVVDLDKKLEEYKRFCFVNEPFSEWNVADRRTDVTPRDFFTQIAAHEYGHILFDKKVMNDAQQRSLLGNESAQFNEGFAFWFSEQIGSCTSLFLSVRDLYGEKEFDTMEKAYDALHDSCKKIGIRRVLENPAGIMVS